MKTILFFCCGLLLAFCSDNSSMKNKNVQHAVKTAASVAMPLLDEDPVPMHSKVVRNTGSGIANADVSLTLQGKSVPAYSGTTDSNGNCTFSAVTPGSYSLKISATGFVTKYADVSILAETYRTDTLVVQ